MAGQGVCRGTVNNRAEAGGLQPSDVSETPKKHWKKDGKEKKKSLIFKNSLVLKSLRPAGEANKF